jgi:hypothetical protein
MIEILFNRPNIGILLQDYISELERVKNTNYNEYDFDYNDDDDDEYYNDFYDMLKKYHSYGYIDDGDDDNWYVEEGRHIYYYKEYISSSTCTEYTNLRDFDDYLYELGIMMDNSTMMDICYNSESHCCLVYDKSIKDFKLLCFSSKSELEDELNYYQ